MNIQDFCDHHSACADGRDWALANCADMQDAWCKLKPGWLIWVATRPGVLTDRELRLFAVFCARQVEHLLTDQRSKHAIEVAERFANRQATGEELAAARAAARDAADAGWAAAGAAWAAALDAARAAADAAWAAADAAWAADRDAARDAQADWLRKNTTPNFGIEVTE